MPVLEIGAAIIAGAFLRLVFGGAPHYHEPGAKKAFYWHRPFVYLVTIAAAFAILSDFSLALWKSDLIVAVLVAAQWSPGHGCYLSPGALRPDTRKPWVLIMAPLGKLLGLPQGSGLYCSLGMGVRYLATSLMVGGGMLACNHFMGSHYNVLYGLSGALAGAVMLVVWKADLMLVTRKPWLDPYYHNGPFEIGLGAVTLGALAALA